jgi:hypothetical protein
VTSAPFAASEWERRFREQVRAGNPPDQLRRFCSDEVERFWARTIPGMDGHVYWDAGRQFRRNDGKTRRPVRWVWEHVHGPLPMTTDVWTTCGEPNCVAVEHLTAGRSARRDWYRTEQIIGAIQVQAMRLGRPPNQKEWQKVGAHPSSTVIVGRFGSWDKAIASAGLDPAKIQRNRGGGTKFQMTPPERIIGALQHFAETFGHTPSSWDWHTKHSGWVREHHYPVARTIRRLGQGSWPEALRRAGFRR